jgi:hypothetical protein
MTVDKPADGIERHRRGAAVERDQGASPNASGEARDVVDVVAPDLLTW